MSAETLETLEYILESIKNPAYIEKNKEIILSNDLLKPYHLNNNLSTKTIELNNDMKLCEIVIDDVYKLNKSHQKLVEAMTLL